MKPYKLIYYLVLLKISSDIDTRTNNWVAFWKTAEKSCTQYKCPELMPPIWLYYDNNYDGGYAFVHDMEFKIECGELNSHFDLSYIMSAS